MLLKPQKEQREKVHEERRKRNEIEWKIMSPTNVWAIGLIMYEMITLDRHDSLHEHSKKFVPDNRGHGLILEPFNTRCQPEYSQEIRDVIRRCLKLEPSRRNTLIDTQVAIDSYRDATHGEMFSQAETGQSVSKPPDKERLYYIGNEIQQMAPGDWRPDPRRKETHPDAQEGLYADPELTPIKFPFFNGANYDDPPSEDDTSNGSHEEDTAVLKRVSGRVIAAIDQAIGPAISQDSTSRRRKRPATDPIPWRNVRRKTVTAVDIPVIQPPPPPPPPPVVAPVAPPAQGPRRNPRRAVRDHPLQPPPPVLAPPVHAPPVLAPPAAGPRRNPRRAARDHPRQQIEQAEQPSNPTGQAQGRRGGPSDTKGQGKAKGKAGNAGVQKGGKGGKKGGRGGGKK